MTACPKEVPTTLTNLHQWVCWKTVERDGRETKIPINPIDGSNAKSNDPATWTDFESACNGHVGLGTSGLGFCFCPDDGLVGIDLDACIDSNGKIAEWALIILSRLDSYAEISPSGRGLKIWCHGKIPKAYKKTLGEKDPEIGKAPGIEVYASGRYFTVTGERWEGSRDDIVACQDQLDWLIAKYWPGSMEPVQTTEPRQWSEGPESVQTVEPSQPIPQYKRADGQQGLSVQERAARYLVKMPVAVSGEHGHDRTFHAACLCVLGFAMTPEQSWPVLAEWNQGCNPPWSEHDLHRKLDQANQQGGERGWLLTGRQYSGPDVNLKAFFEFCELADGPKIESSRDLIRNNPALAPVLIDGLLRRGETANIIAAPKRGKSWMTYGLALSVATGRAWLDRYQTHQGRVLLIDNELHPTTLAYRLPKVADAMGIAETEYAYNLDIFTLRGKLLNIEEVASKLAQHGRGYYSLIIIDAWYRMIPAGVSENDNAEMTQLYNLIDQCAAATNAGWCLVHHASKGNQTEKAVTDVGAGAGAQSRAADSHIILREHTNEDHSVLDAAVRSFPPLEPVTLRWEFPLWSATDVNPHRLANAQQQRQTARDADGIAQLLKALEKSDEWQSIRALRNETGFGADRCRRLLNLMTENLQVEPHDVKTNGKDSTEYRLSGHTQSIKELVERSGGVDQITNHQTTAV